MILLQLAMKSLRNRKFSSALAIASISLSVALFFGVERIRDGARESFSQSISQTDLVVGARGSPLQLLLYTVFHIGDATNNISWKTYEHFKKHPEVEWTIPISLGDSHRGYRVVATDESFYQHYRFRKDTAPEFLEGRGASDVFEVVIGADLAQKLHYKLNQSLVLSHGVTDGMFKHDDKPFHVVGIFKKTGTALDRSLFVSLYGMEAIHMDWKNGAPPREGKATPVNSISKANIKVGQITSFLMRSKSRISILRLQREINDYEEEAMMAVIPGVTLMKLWDSLGYVEDALKIVSAFVVLVGFVAMLIALYTSLQERRREMAILRVLGAGPQKILFLLVLESTFLTSMGLLCGISLIYLLLFMGQPLIESRFGLFVPIKIFSAKEIVTAAIMLLGGLLIGFVPAFKAYKNTLSDGLTIRT